MRTTALAAVLALFIAAPTAVSLAADLPSGHPPLDQSRQATAPTHLGQVVEALPAAGYVYLHVKGAEGDEWLAAPAADFKPGAKVRWNDGTAMQNFTSKALNRTFATIRFVEVVERAD
jgi:hypothetical protein